jgi:membrane-bound serine protease (ClpP class)
MYRRLVALVALLALVPALVACAPERTADAVHVAEVRGAVDNVLERYVERVVAHAEDTEARVIVLVIDTPGGEIGAMKRTAGHIERSSIPIVTWVGPPGAQAVSAGTFILMAGHVAAMAPGTSTGAASPVLGGGQDLPETLGRKVEEDTVAFARGIAETHGRNADWAESAVREAAAASPQQALDLNVIDLLAPSLDALLTAIDGREVTLLEGPPVTLDLEGATRLENPMTGFERFLKVIASPAVVSLLILIGIAGIAVEFFSPGLLLPGTAGIFALIVGFLGAGALLPAEAALVLLVLAIVLLTAEFFMPSGILGGIGVLALLMAIMLWAGQAATAVSAGRVLLVTAGVLLVVVLGAVLLIRYFDRQGSGETHREPI